MRLPTTRRSDRPPPRRVDRDPPRPRSARRVSRGKRLGVVPGRHSRWLGRRAPRPPQGPEARGWDAFSAGARVTSRSSDPRPGARAERLFGDGRALDEVRAWRWTTRPDWTRRAALLSLIESRPPDLRAVCERLLRVRFLNATAVRGLALFDDPEIGRSLAANYKAFHPSERAAVLDTLVSRPAFARALLDAMAGGKVPPAELTAFHARQIRSLGHPDLDRRLAEVWGELRRLGPGEAGVEDRSSRSSVPRSWPRPTAARARRVQQALRLVPPALRQGGQIGPDLTGAGRDNLDYLLENIIDPSATVTADFRMVVVAMQDGRVLNGIVKSRNERTLTLQTQNELLVLDRGEIEGLKPTTASLMPEGQLESLAEAEVRDLIAYLMHRTQVPLPSTGN